MAMGLLVLLAFAAGARPQEPQQPKGESAEAPAPLPKGKKLILKDGSNQLVRSYEVKGDRVRFYSIERSQWEEIPNDLVDWDATHKVEAEEASKNQALVEKLAAEEKTAKAQPIDVDASIEAAPGVFLPPGEGFFVLDGKALLPLTQAEANTKLDKGRLLEQVVVPVPVVPSRRRVYVKGARAKFRITNNQPEFFMRTADSREPQMVLIRAAVKGDSRVIENLDTLFVGKSEKRNELSLQSWQLTKGVYRFTLGQALTPGEYAFAEITNEGMNLFVWDFGVDAAATKPSSK